MVRRAMLLGLLTGAVTLSATAPIQPISAAGATGSLARPPVSGAAGSYDRVTVILRRIGRMPHAPFAGFMRLPDGRSLPLAGPDLPADFFRVDPTDVLFTPVDRTRANGVVVLYDSGQIGPEHGTDHLALVYRVSRNAARRVPSLEDRLEGVRSAAQARFALHGSKR